MDAFDLAEQQLSQSTAQTMRAQPEGTTQLPAGDTVTNNFTGSTAVAELPDAQPPAPSMDMRQTQIVGDSSGVTMQKGGDPFDVAEATLKLHTAMDAGDNLAPYLKRLSQLQVPELDNTRVNAAAADLQQAMQPRTTVGGDVRGAINGAVPQSLDYDTWQKLRRAFMVKYPNQPLPPDLQVFDFAGDHTDAAGNAVPIDQLQQAAFHNTDRPLLHDQSMIDEARALIPDGQPMPEVLKGTIEQREQAEKSASVQALRAKYPAAKDLSDDQLSKFDTQVLEHQGQQLVVQALKTDPNFGPGLKDQSDGTILELVKRNPDLYRDAIAKAMLPALASSAAQRIQRRQTSGPLQDDDTGQAGNDQAIVQAAHQVEVGNAGAAAAARHPLWAAFNEWVNAADLGLPAQIARLGGADNKEKYDAFRAGYQTQHPIYSMLASTLGYMTPGSPAWFLGKALGPAIGQPIRNAVAAVAGEESIGGAVQAAGRAVAPTAFNNAGILSKLAASSLAGGAEMPVFTAVNHLIDGHPLAALQSLDMSRQDSRMTAAMGMMLNPVLEHTPTLLLRGVRDLWVNRQLRNAVGSDFTKPFGDVGIELSTEQKESALRVAKARNDYSNGKDFWQAMDANKVTLKDLASTADLLSKFKRASVDQSAKQPAGAPTAATGTAAAGPAGGVDTDQAAIDALLKQATFETPPELKPKPANTDLLSPREASIARARNLLDQYAPKGPDGTRSFTKPALDAIAGDGKNRALMDELLGERDKTTGLLQRAKALADMADAEVARRIEPSPEQGIGGRKLPAPPADLGQPDWKPKLSSMTAAKSRAQSRLQLDPSVKFGKTTQIATNQILDTGSPTPDGIKHWMRKFAPGPENQSDAVPPIVVRKLANGGWQVLDGADQLAAAQNAGFKQVPVIEAIGAPEPARSTKTEVKKPTGVAPTSMIKNRAEQKAGLMRAVKPGEVIHGTDARNLQLIARDGIHPSRLSGDIDAELVPAGGFGSDTPSTAITYAVGRSSELPVAVVLKPGTNRGTPAKGLVNHIAVTSEGKSYVHPDDVEAVVFPDGTRLPLKEALKHYDQLKGQLQNRLPEKAPVAADLESGLAGNKDLLHQLKGEAVKTGELAARAKETVERLEPARAGDTLPAEKGGTNHGSNQQVQDDGREVEGNDEAQLGSTAGEEGRLEEERQGQGRLLNDEKPAAGVRATAGDLPPGGNPTGTPTWIPPAITEPGASKIVNQGPYQFTHRADGKIKVSRAGRFIKLTPELEAKARKALGIEPVEQLPAIKQLVGRAQPIETATDPVPSAYAIVSAKDLIPSHDAHTFKPSEKYPPNVQERDYQHSKDEKAKVQQNDLDFNPVWLLTDNPDPVNGPPMILPNGRVMGGNSRAMVIQRVYGMGGVMRGDGKSTRATNFRSLVIGSAERFGIRKEDAAGVEDPVLVRVIQEETNDPARMRVLVRVLQKGRTQEMSGAMDAASRARILLDSPGTLERLQSVLGDDESIREVMSTPAKVAELKSWLIKSEVLTKQEYARFEHPETGMLSEDGKRLIERILQAVAIPDVGVFDNLPAATANKITGNLFGIVYPKTLGREWDFTADLQQALYGFLRWRAAQAPLDAWLKGEAADGQKLMVADRITESDMKRARLLLRRLVNDNSVGWRERIRAYMDHARNFRPGETTFAFATDSQVTPAKAWAAAFENDVPTDRAGKPVTAGKLERAGGGLFGGGPEKYFSTLDELRDMLSYPELMSQTLRGALHMPRRITGQGPTFMATAGGDQSINPAELLKDPAVAERLARIATFHLEQQAEAGDKMLRRWAEGVRSDLSGILKDLGYTVEDSGFTDLLSKLWSDLAADEDVKSAIGELPPFKREAASDRLRKASAAQGRAGATPTGGAGDGSAPGGELVGGSDVRPGSGNAGVVPGSEGSGAGLPDEPGRRDGLPEWLGPGQSAHYLDALRSDRVSPYVPLPPWRRGHHHPRLLVESKALAGVRAGDLAGYELDPRAAADVSDPQRDQAAAIGYRIHVANAGALIADDVGVGKSRVIGATIADQIYRSLAGLSGKRKILVLTKNRQNIADLINTFTVEQRATFDPLAAQGLSIVNASGMEPAGLTQYQTRNAPTVMLGDSFNLVKYLKPFTDWRPDLVIVDEAHLLSNLEGDTQRANALELLHEALLPSGQRHFVYMTATPASDIAALKFMYGLRLWDPPKMAEKLSTSTFDGWLQNATGISKAGSWRESIATPIIEQLMRELKMDNAYHSLDFWRGGFEFNMREAAVTPEQLALYDVMAENLNHAIRLYASARKLVNNSKWPHPKKKGQLWSPPRPDGQAIFFIKRLLVEYRLPAAIAEAQAALARGEQVVFKILGVSDTHLTGQGGNLGAVLDAIPTQRAVKDAKGEIQKWEDQPDAIAALKAIRQQLAATGRDKSPSPLQKILDAFGEKNVAAIVGATSPKARIEQNAEFQSGKRKVAVISPAGTTGINLQDLGSGRRFMVVLDLDWDSKEFKQSLGRVDRANQVTSPAALTIFTPIAGERKFQATIAARMKSLGAISKGQEDAGAESDALNDFDMESSTWHRAINETVRALPRQQQDLLLHQGKLDEDDLSWRDFQNDLMMLPHQLGNEIYDKAHARWQELEAIESAKTGGKVARRNRGMIRQSIELDTNHPLQIHTVESTTGETYGILQGKLLTRPKDAVPLPVIQDAIYGKSGSQALRNHYVTMQQGENVVSGLYVPRGKIETVKALFGKSSQRNLFTPPEGGGQPAELPTSIVDQLPPQLQLHATTPNIPPAVLSAKHQPQTMSRQQITDFVINKLKLAVAVGKQRRLAGPKRRALGYYWNKLIRQHVANQIAVLAHEVGHAIDDRITGLKPPATFDTELLPLGRRTSRKSYTKAQVRKEGVAEWFRIFMYDPVQAQTLAPGYSTWFEGETLKEPELWQAIKELQGMYAQYLAQDPVQKLESQINFDDDGPTIRSPRGNEGAYSYLYRHIADHFAPLDWMRKDIIGGGQLPDTFDADAYVAARLNAGNPGMVLSWVKYGVRDRDGRTVAKGIEPVMRENGIRSAKQIRNFEAYLVAQRADELYTQAATVDPTTGKHVRELKHVVDPEAGPLGVSWDQAKATIAKYESPAFRAAAQGVWRWNHAVLKSYMEQSGFFAPGQIDAVIALNQRYVRWSRVLDYMEQHGSSAGLVDKGKALHQIRGSGRRIERPIGAMIRNIRRMVDLVDGNRAGLLAFELIRKGKDYTYADKITRPIAPTSGQLEEIKKYLIAAGADPLDFEPSGPGGTIPPKIDLQQTFTIFRPIAHNPRDLEIALRVAGKIHVWQLHDPALYDAVTARTTSLDSKNLILRVLTLPASIMRRGFTLYLNFVTGNVMRDTITARMQTRYGFLPIVDNAVGLYHLLRRDETYQLYLHSKASHAGMVGSMDDPIEREMHKLYRSAFGSAKHWLNMPARFIDLLEALSNGSDDATRLGEFARALKKEGVNREGLARASLAARDVTVDFNRGGSWAKDVGKLRAFFNAMIQGTDTFARNVKNRPGTMFIRSLPLVAMSLLLNYLCKDNPDYQERANERQGYWLFPIGDPKTTRSWFRFRKPQEWGFVLGTALPAMIEAALNEDPKLLQELIPSPGAALNMALDMVTALKPLYEVAANYDYFNQRPIVPDDLKRLEPELQQKRFTSETAKFIGKHLNMSPLLIDHLIYGYTGTFGRSVVKSIDDGVFRPLAGITKTPPPADDWKQSIPGLQMMFGRELEPSSAQSLADFYALSDRLDRVKASIPHYSGDQLKSYIARNRDVLQKADQIKAAGQALKDLRAAMTGVYESDALTPEVKRQRLRVLMAQMVNIARGIGGKSRYPATPGGK
jgi:hypothetical protein